MIILVVQARLLLFVRIPDAHKPNRGVAASNLSMGGLILVYYLAREGMLLVVCDDGLYKIPVSEKEIAPKFVDKKGARRFAEFWEIENYRIVNIGGDF